jgi:signal transduction histidine kinase
VTAALVVGWLVAVALGAVALRQRRRLDRVADAEHELRGALTAFGLGVARFARTAAGRRLSWALEAELARARAALDRAHAHRTERSGLERLVRSAAAAWAPDGNGIEVDWPAGLADVSVESGPVAQVLGNVVSNAVEHGSGPVVARGLARPGSVRVEITNRAKAGAKAGAGDHGVAAAPGGDGRDVERGRGLRIAERAAHAAGGRLTVSRDPHGVAAVLEIPVER